MNTQKYKVVIEESRTAVFFIDYSFKSAEQQLKKFLTKIKDKVQVYKLNYSNIGDKWILINKTRDWRI